jgi:GTPase SAR1 family protein
MTTIKVTFAGPRGSGKSTLMRAMLDRLGLTAEVLDPLRRKGHDDEHTLIVPVTDETLARLREPQPAYLGLATTGELLAELQARADVGGYADYRTVDPK